MTRIHFFYGTGGMDMAAKLIQDYNEFSVKFSDTWVIKPQNSISSEPKIVSKSGLECPAEILTDIKWKDIIRRREFYYTPWLINDIHLFKQRDIDNLVKLADTYSRLIFCYGLMTNPNERLFPASKHLIEVGAKLHELPCMCQMIGCKNSANHTLRYHERGYVIREARPDIDKEKIVYKSVCQHCYDSEMRKSR